jgi:FkbM family methyltransferase
MLKKIPIKLLQQLSKLFLGKGFIDRFFPFLIPLFQKIYASLQQESIKTVTIPLELKFKVFTKDIGVGLPLIIKGQYEPKQTELFIQKIKEGDLVLDIGANVGYYTLLASKLVGATGKVISFEPDKENYSLLRENLILNDCKNVEIKEEAISDRNGLLAFNTEINNKGESAISENGKDKVLSLTLDSFSSQIQFLPSLIKIDIEGAEIFALKGGNNFFSSCINLKLFIEYNPSSIKRLGNNPKLLIETILRLNFKIKQIIDESRSIILPYSEQNLEQVLKHTTYCNLFCEKTSSD